MSNEFADNYPESKFAKEAQELKKDAEKGIVDVKKLLAGIATEKKVKTEENKNQDNDK